MVAPRMPNTAVVALEEARPVVASWDWWVPPWLAALVDGEGAVMMMRRNRTPTTMRSRTGGAWRCKIAVYNTKCELTDRILGVTGLGYIIRHTRHPVRDSHKNTSYQWNIESGGIRLVAEAILPFSVIKRKQLGLLIEARLLIEDHTCTSHNDSRLAEIQQEVRLLNRRGRVSNGQDGGTLKERVSG